MSFWSELKRRNVVKVGAAYVIVAWLIVQIANTFFPILHLPDWTVTLVAVLVILGFPLALLFAWAFELTPEGLKKTEHVPLEESITHITGRKLDYILGGLLIIAVAYILFDNLYLDRRVAQTDAPKTIAVLPFDDLSPEKDQEYFVDGVSEEIINYLAQIPDLTVIARTSSFSFKGTTKKIQEIGSELGVAHILEGSVRKAGNALRITAQLIKAVDGSHLWSKTYDKEFNVEEMFSVQKDIATAVANELKVTFGVDESLKQLGGTDNVDAYDLYLLAKKQFSNAEFALAFNNFEAAIDLDPEFALAWSYRALGLFFSGKPDEGIKAAQKAIELEPNLVEAYANLARIRFAKGEYIKAGLAFQKAAELTTKPLGTIETYIVVLLNFGYLEQAREAVEASLRSDPLNADVQSNAIQVFGRLGDLQRAEEVYERAKAMSGETLVNTLSINGARLLSGNVVSSDDIVDPNPIMVALKEYVGSPKEGLAELHRLYNDEDYQDFPDGVTIGMWAPYFGDPELALEALKGFSDLFWYPSMKQVRQLPGFKERVRDAGLVDYWEHFGWPDLCKPTDDGDFVCD